MRASPIELAWSIIAAVGGLLTAWMILDAYLDYRAVAAGVRGGYAKARGARWWSAVGAIGANGLDGFVWAGFLAVGLMAIFDIWPAWAGWVLIAMEAVLAARQLWARFARLQTVGRPHLPPAGAQP